MNSITIFALFAVLACFTASSWALPVDNTASSTQTSGSSNSEDVVAVPITLIDVESTDAADSDESQSNTELRRSARGLGLGGFGGKFGGGLGGLGHGLKGFGGGFGGFGGGLHGLGGGLGLLKFKPFFNKFG